MKGNLRILYDHLQLIEPEFIKVSDKTAKKNIINRVFLKKNILMKNLKDILKLTTCRTVVFQINKTTFTLEICHKNEKLDTLDTLDTFINTLMYILSFVYMLRHNVRNIHMKYYLSDIKRVLDGDTFFDKEEVNGGSCWSAPDECSITVWRKEEILKVSIVN